MCGQPPTVPFEAPCGHMACYGCWEARLRVQEVCPQEDCGAAVCLARLTRRYLP